MVNPPKIEPQEGLGINKVLIIIHINDTNTHAVNIIWRGIAPNFSLGYLTHALQSCVMLFGHCLILLITHLKRKQNTLNF